VLATIRIDVQFKPLVPAGAVGSSDVATQYVVAQNAPLQIDNHTDRRLLYSTAMVQEMAVCQCGTQSEPTVDQPLITSVGTSGMDTAWIQMIVANPVGAQIYYTIDNTDPVPGAPNTTLFGLNNDNVPIPMAQLPVIVKAIGVRPGYGNSPVASLSVTHP
jgi:hypothetical protein